MSPSEDLARILAALHQARAALEPLLDGVVQARMKEPDDPVTEADLAVDRVLRHALLDHGEGWLSEETADDRSRLGRERVWVVDPLDGTREFVEGIPEWCVSVGLVVEGRPLAGGVMSPTTGRMVVGAVGVGATLDGAPVEVSATDRLQGALVLASRSEVKRHEWDRFFHTPISIRNMGSVAYKLALVAAGEADATWTLVPKHEWDVAAGTALVLAAGGRVSLLDGSEPVFNREVPRLDGLIATNAALMDPVRELIAATR